jgi:DNA-binding transcriptional MerR regulator
MALKMKELIAKSNESKSTILYYVKEGLLPSPQKPKPNVHLYDDSCVDIIKFIKYLQQNFSYSISDIKHIFEHNHFNFDGSFHSMIESLELISGGKDMEFISKEELLSKTSITQDILDEYIKKGYIYPRDNDIYSTKELQVIDILQRAKQLGLDFELIDRYVSTAKELALLENQIGFKLLESDTTSHNSRYELLFDVILNLKPYIFNMQTVSTHLHNIKDKS